MRMVNVERTFVFVKPDGVLRGLIGEIIKRLEQAGLKIIALKMLKLTREQAEKLYDIHKGKHFFEPLVNYVTSGPIVAMILEGPDAVKKVRKLIGKTNPVEADAGTIRGDFALTISRNVIHAADSKERAEYEMKIIFKDDEIVSYKRVDEDIVWFTE